MGLNFLDQGTPGASADPAVNSFTPFSGVKDDVAELRALPVNKMLKQAGRPLMERIAKDDMNGERYPWWGESKADFSQKQANQLQKRRALGDLVINRIQSVNKAIENWDPLASEFKQRENQLRDVKKSSLSNARYNEDFLRNRAYKINEMANREVTRSWDDNNPYNFHAWPRHYMDSMVDIYSELARYNGSIEKADKIMEEALNPRQIYWKKKDGTLEPTKYAEMLKHVKKEYQVYRVPLLNKENKAVLEQLKITNRQNTLDMLDMTRDVIQPIPPYSKELNTRNSKGI